MFYYLPLWRSIVVALFIKLVTKERNVGGHKSLYPQKETSHGLLDTRPEVEKQNVVCQIS